MSNIHQSIIEKLTALNIDIYHYEEIVRCYALAKLNLEHSGKLDYTDGVHSAEFDAEAGKDLIAVDLGQLCTFDDLSFFNIPYATKVFTYAVSIGLLPLGYL